MVRRDLFSSMHDGSLPDEGAGLLRTSRGETAPKKKLNGSTHPLYYISVDISVIFGFNLPDVHNRNASWLVHGA